MTRAPLMTLVGFGSGNGLGIARSFGAAGFQLALVSRTPLKQAAALQQLTADGINAESFVADSGNPQMLTAALSEVAAKYGNTDVLIYNVMSPSFGRPSTLTPSGLAADFAVNVIGGLVAAQAVLPALKQKKSGAILFTGSGWALYPLVEAASASIRQGGIAKPHVHIS